MLDCFYVSLVSLFFNAEISSASLPFFGDLDDYRGDQSQDRACIWKKSSVSDSAFDLLVERFIGVGCSQVQALVVG
jgi:hypothetical protein